MAGEDAEVGPECGGGCFARGISYMIYGKMLLWGLHLLGAAIMAFHGRQGAMQTQQRNSSSNTSSQEDSESLWSMLI